LNLKTVKELAFFFVPIIIGFVFIGKRFLIVVGVLGLVFGVRWLSSYLWKNIYDWRIQDIKKEKKKN